MNKSILIGKHMNVDDTILITLLILYNTTIIYLLNNIAYLIA